MKPFDYNHYTGVAPKRLSYLGVIADIVSKKDCVNFEVLCKRLIEHTEHNITVNTTGLIKSKASAVDYIKFADGFSIIAKSIGAYQTGKYAKLLRCFRHNANVESLNLSQEEKLFFTYLLLKNDSDVILSILLYIKENSGYVKTFEQIAKALPVLLRTRILVKCQDTCYSFAEYRMSNINRVIVNGKLNPGRIVTSRLAWLMDLGIIYKDKTYYLTPYGHSLLDCIPKINIERPKINAMFYDVSKHWMSTKVFDAIANNITVNRYSKMNGQVKENTAQHLCDVILPRMFLIFPTNTPKIRLDIAMLYFCVFSSQNRSIAINPYDIREMLKMGREVNGYRYNVRRSARDNESYIIRQQI